MKIVILGQGAIGTLWAAQLIKVPEVTLSVYSTSPITAAENLAHINMAYSNFNGQSEQLTVIKATQPHLLEAEVLLVCLKAPHVVSAITPLLEKLPDSITVILCHNGMGTLDELIPLLPDASSVLAMMTTHGAFRPSPKHTIHTGLGKTDLGLVKGELHSSKFDTLIAILNQTLPKVFWQENITEKQWLKLAINCVINPITALNNIPNGEILNPSFNTLINTLSHELSQVAQSQGVSLAPDYIVKQVFTVAQNTAKNRSSMLCDISQQQPTEVDYINGYVIKLATKAGIPVPQNETLFAQVKFLELSQ